jgi:hypothetical protein
MQLELGGFVMRFDLGVLCLGVGFGGVLDFGLGGGDRKI